MQVLVKRSPLHSRQLAHTVVVSDINADAANHVVDEIQLGGQAFACRCDITSEQELSALADFAVSRVVKLISWLTTPVVLNRLMSLPNGMFRRAYELANVFSFY